MGQVAVIRVVETGVLARLSEDGWTCEDQAFRDRLNREFPPRRMGGDDPNPIANTAGRAAQGLLAEAVHVPETEPTRAGWVH